MGQPLLEDSLSSLASKDVARFHQLNQRMQVLVPPHGTCLRGARAAAQHGYGLEQCMQDVYDHAVYKLHNDMCMVNMIMHLCCSTAA